MERSSDDEITKALIAHESAQAKLTPEERDILAKLDDETSVFETKRGRQMSDEEWEGLLQSMPGARDAIEKYTKLVDFFENVQERGNSRIN